MLISFKPDYIFNCGFSLDFAYLNQENKETTVKPLITNISKELIKCRILHFLIMECCRYLVFNKMIIWNSLKLFPYIHGYLFVFANTEIYVI